jgi:hypothetical protein
MGANVTQIPKWKEGLYKECHACLLYWHGIYTCIRYHWTYAKVSRVKSNTSGVRSPAQALKNYAYSTYGAGEAQYVQCVTTDWRTCIRSPTQTKNVSSSLYVRTVPGAHPASCTTGNVESVPCG